MARALFGFLIAAACAGATPAQGPPAWVLRRPEAAGYFVGIGIARTAGDLPAARKAATQQALEDIALQVEARVFAQSRLRVEEGGEGMKQEYRSEIHTQTAEELAGVEIAGTYEDREHSWVYARLSVEEFQRHRQERSAAARRGAFALFTQAQAEGPAGALALYLRALAPLQQGAGDPLHVEYQGVSLALATEIPLRIQHLLSAMRLELVPAAIRVKQRAALDQGLQVRAYFGGGEGRPVPAVGLPLRWRFTRGEGDLTASTWTGPDGVARSRLRQVRAAGRTQTIEVRPYLAALLGPDLGPTLEPLVEGFSPPAACIEVQVVPQAICVSSEEWNLGEPLHFLGPLLKGWLERGGEALVDHPEGADLLLALSARTRKGTQTPGVCFAYLDLEIRARDRATGQEIYTFGLRDIKGAGPDGEQAGLRAYARASRQLEAQLLGELVAGLNR